MRAYPLMQCNISLTCDCAMRCLYRRAGGILLANEIRRGNAFDRKSAAHGRSWLMAL